MSNFVISHRQVNNHTLIEASIFGHRVYSYQYAKNLTGSLLDSALADFKRDFVQRIREVLTQKES